MHFLSVCVGSPEVVVFWFLFCNLNLQFVPPPQKKTSRALKLLKHALNVAEFRVYYKNVVMLNLAEQKIAPSITTKNI